MAKDTKLKKKGESYRIIEQESDKLSTLCLESHVTDDNVVHVHWHKDWPCLKRHD